MRIAIVGAGAVGGYVGAHLTAGGHDVVMIDPWPDHVNRLKSHGMEIFGMTPEERMTVKVQAMHLTEIQSLSKQKPIDIAFVSMKSYDTEWATALIKQYLAPDGFVVSLQNCLNEERIANQVGWGKTVGMVASLISVDMFEAARIRRTVAKGGDKHTVFRVGEVHGRITKRVEELRDMVGRIDSAKTTTNLWGERWSKLCQNGMKNGVSAATGLTGADCDRNDAIRRFSIKLGGEAVRVGQALGYHIEKIGKMEPESLAKASEGDKAALDEIVHLGLHPAILHRHVQHERPMEVLRFLDPVLDVRAVVGDRAIDVRAAAHQVAELAAEAVADRADLAVALRKLLQIVPDVLHVADAEVVVELVVEIERLLHVIGILVGQFDARLLPPEQIRHEADESRLRELMRVVAHGVVDAPDLHDGDDRADRLLVRIGDVGAHRAVAQLHLDVFGPHCPALELE